MPHRETAPTKETVMHQDLSPLESHCAEEGLDAARKKLPSRRITVAIEGQIGWFREELKICL